VLLSSTRYSGEGHREPQALHEQFSPEFPVLNAGLPDHPYCKQAAKIFRVPEDPGTFA